MIGWGCQLFQSNGEWFVVHINERASDQIYYTKYNQAGVYQNAGHITQIYNIDAYSEDGNMYFVDNSQFKVMRQGYPQMYFKTQVKFPRQFCSNGQLKYVSGGLPMNWVLNTAYDAHTSFTEDPVLYNFFYAKSH